MDDSTWLTDEQLAAWRRLMVLLNLLPGRLEETLQPLGLNFFEYGVLAMLSDAPDNTLRMSRLAALANASPSRLSHAAARLEGRGWIERRGCADDGRVTLASLTPDGIATLERVAPGHVASVKELVFNGLDDDKVRQLHDICGELLGRVAPDLLPPWEGADGW